MNTSSRKRKNYLRKGFTLIELLIVVAIIAILGGVAVLNLGDPTGEARITATYSSINTIKQAVETFNIKVGRYPKSLDELMTPINDAEVGLLEPGLTDSWGVPFEYKLEGRQKYTIISAGPDGQFGTEDDLSNRDTKK